MACKVCNAEAKKDICLTCRRDLYKQVRRENPGLARLDWVNRIGVMIAVLMTAFVMPLIGAMLVLIFIPLTLKSNRALAAHYQKKIEGYQ